MKPKRLLSLLTALVMLVSLLPAAALPASATGSGYRTVLVGIIEYVYNDIGDDFRLHYWGGPSGVDDVTIQYIDGSLDKSVGDQYWNGDPQPFRLYTAKIPEDATGFKLWHPNSSRWFGSDGDAQNEDRVFLFEYGGSDLALYGTPVTTVGTPEDWSRLAEDVEFGQDYRGRTVTMVNGLDAPIPIGRYERPFRGCFDGGDNLLTVRFDDRGMSGLAPFASIADGAIIQNLNVEGEVIGGWHAGGLVGFCQGGDQNDPNRIKNCRVAVNVGGGDYNGGIVGHGTNSCLFIDNCVYSGVLSDSGFCCGGLQGWADGNDLTVNNCLSCGSYTASGTYDPIAVGYGSRSFNNAFYTGEPLHTSSEGTQVSLDIPHDSLAMEANVLGIQVWILGQTEVDGIADWYLYDGSEHTISPVVRYDGHTLTENVDYVWTIDGDVVTGVTEKGIHDLTVTGIGPYNGSVTLPVTVVPAALTGSGTSGDPWIINDGADWVRLSLDVEDGNTFSNEYVWLENDIPVIRKVGVVNGGSQDIPFSGIFEGSGHTIYVNITDTANQGTAPFCYINGATIRNLNVTGSVYGDYHAAGLVGFTKDQNNLIENCVVDTDVYANDYIGGIVGHALDSDLIIDHCLYSGLLVGGYAAKGALLGWDDPGGLKNINYCCYALRDGQSINSLDLYMGLSGDVTLDHCYRTTDDCQLGTRVYDFPQPDRVNGKVEIAGHTFILPCEISGVPTVCNTASGLVTLSPLVDFDGSFLTEDVDYELDVVLMEGMKSPTVFDPGRYELHVTGINDFDGTQVFSFQVGQIFWTMEDDGSGQYSILHISGHGPMEDLGPYPWDGSDRYGVPEANLGDITTLVIDVGVTAIGDYAFDGFSNLKKVLIPAGMEQIGEYAFPAVSSSFTQLRLPPSLKTIEQGAFHGLSDVTDVWTGRDAPGWQDFLNSPEVELTDNQVLTGWNNNWQPVNYHDSVVSNIQTAPTPEGTVRFMVDGADANQAGDGQLVQVVPEPADGYLLDGLDVSFDENGVTYNFSIQPITAFTMAFDSNVTVTPHFRAIVYSIMYQGLAGVSPLPQNPISYTVQTPSFTLNNPAKPGYDFLGWTLNGSTTAPVLNYTVSQGTVGNLFFTANWRAHSYGVHFDPNGADAGSMADQSFTYDVPQPLDPNIFTRTGYVFTGWNTLPDGSGTSYTDGDTVLNLTAVNNGLVTLYAQWAPIHYTVQFDPNGGTGNMTDQGFTYDAPQNLDPNAFTLTGYNFAGWNTMPDGSGAAFGDQDPVLNLTATDNDLVILFAQWAPHQYFVHFEPNGGTGNMPDQHFFYDQPQPLDICRYTRAGYDFAEWNTQPDGSGTAYTDEEVVQNLTATDNDTVSLFAQWNPICYTIQFDPNGGTGSMPDQLFTYDVSQNLNANVFTNAGYNFAGWNTMPDGSGVAYGDQDPILNLTTANGAVITLYAQWAGWSYFIHFEPNHSSAVGSMGDEPFFHGQLLPLPGNAFSVPGYHFLGWSLTQTGSVVYTDGDLINLLPTFDGETISLYAQWAPNTYNIQFEPNGGGGTMADMAFVYDSPGNLDLNAFTRPGYDFTRWNTQPDGSGTNYADGALVNIATNSDGESVILYAQWRAHRYFVSFDRNHPNATGNMANQRFTYDTPQALTANAFTLAGYSFDSWNDDPAGLGTVYQDCEIVNIPPPSNNAVIPLFAQWKANNYVVVFNANPPAGTTATGTMPSMGCVYGTPTPLTLNAFSIQGYTFQGWDTVPTGTTWTYNDGAPINIPAATNGQVITLYAKWRPNTFIVHFDPNQGTGAQMPDQSFTYDVSQALFANTYTMANYVFAGWCDDIEGNGTYYQDREVVSNLTDQDGVVVTLYAIWEPIHCTVIFHGNHPGGLPDVTYTQIFYWDQPQNLIPNPYSYSGYGFDHWDTLPGGGGTVYIDGQQLVNFWTTNGQVIDLYAQWHTAQYTVGFDPNGAPGPWMPDQLFTYGVSQQLSQNQYNRPGYRFDGWRDWNGNIYSDGQTVQDLTDVDGALIILEAQWTPYQYTIRFSPNPPGNLVPWDGAMLDMYMTYDQGRNLIANAYNCQGYHFSHWNTRTDNTGTDYSNQQFVNIVPAYDGEVITLFAQWKANTYTVIFDSNGGSGSMPNQIFTYDQYGTLHLNSFSRVGYTFTGWNTRSDGSGTAYADGATIANLTAVNNGSVTLYAQWRPNTYTVQFDRNGANLGRMQPQSFTYDVAQALDLNVFVKFNSHFVAWSTLPDGSGARYQDGEAVMNLTAVDGGVVTLYAQWAPGLWEIGTEIIGGSLVFAPAPPCEAGTVVTFEANPDPGNVLYSISAVYYDVEGMPVDLELERLGEEELMWTFVMPEGDVMITAVFAPPMADGFYLIGPDWTLAAIDETNLFTPDPAMEDQYLLQTTLTEGQQIKVVKVVDGAIEAWYPDGFGNEYTVDADHAGEKTILFREYTWDDWMEFGGYFWIEANAAPTEPIETTALRVFSSISVGTDMIVTFSAQKAALTDYGRFWIEVVKHAPEGDMVYAYGADQATPLNENDTTWQVDFNHIFAKEMGTVIEARLFAEDDSGQIWMSPARTTCIRDYLGGRLTATNNRVEQRVLAADMLNYGAAAQMYMDYETDHLVNEELTAAQLAKLHLYETADLPPVEKTNSNYRPEGQANILFNSVSLDNEVILSLSVRANEGDAVMVLMKDHETGDLVENLEAAWNGASFSVDYKGIGAEKMRVAYDFTAEINGVETGNTRTWSIEGYVGEIRNGNLPLKTAMANALLTYGDSAAAYFAAQ